MYESLAMIDNDQTPLIIIHGPPGTGKSTVTAEIVLQIHQRIPDWNILVMAPSHAATDNILLVTHLSIFANCVSIQKYQKSQNRIDWSLLMDVSDCWLRE